MIENITLGQISAGFAILLILIAGAQKLTEVLFGKTKSDIKSNKECITKLQETDKKTKESIANLTTSIDKLTDVSNITLQSLLALIDHEIDGNGIDGMKNVRTELHKAIVKK